MDNKVEQFLRELSEITALYQIEIGGCGCCGSPFLWDTHKKEYLADKINYNEEKEEYEIGEE